MVKPIGQAENINQYICCQNLYNIGIGKIILLQRVERVQEVLVFLRTISISYIIIAITVMAVAPQSVTLGSTNIRIPHGILVTSNAGVSSNFMNGLSAFGVGCFLFTTLTFALLFFYHYRKTAGQMSTVFAPKNIPVFLVTFGLFCLVQAILMFYSKVDPNFLMERLTRSKKWDEFQTRMGINPNSTNTQFELAAGGQTTGNKARTNNEQQQQQSNQNYTINMLSAMEKYDAGGAPTSEGRLLAGVFGTDYSRNPLYFLSNSVFAISILMASLITLIIPLIITCNLYGKQESMSDKSQVELQKFTRVLMVEGYLPAFLTAIASINYIICKIMGESILAFQEFFCMIVIAPIPVIFALINLFFLREFRYASWQILVCRIWSRNQRRAKADAERKAMENIDEELASATRNKHRNKNMKSTELVVPPPPVTASQLSVSTIGSNEVTSPGRIHTVQTFNENRGKIDNTNQTYEDDNRYITAIDDDHRQARALFGKQG